MTRLEVINALLTKVKAGEWDGKCATELWPRERMEGVQWVHEYSFARRAFNGSTDDAIALCEAVLPGAEYGVANIGSLPGKFNAKI